MTIQAIATDVIFIPVTIVQWAPRDWSSRKAWGERNPDGFYLTAAGELYRLCGQVVTFVDDRGEIH